MICACVFPFKEKRGAGIRKRQEQFLSLSVLFSFMLLETGLAILCCCTPCVCIWKVIFDN